jgi:peroxiredoxin
MHIDMNPWHCVPLGRADGGETQIVSKNLRETSSIAHASTHATYDYLSSIPSGPSVRQFLSFFLVIFVHRPVFCAFLTVSLASHRRRAQQYLSNFHCLITAIMSNAAPLRLGSIAPNFQAETTQGKIDFHEWLGDSWAILFSHPEDYTPVCTTELGAFAKLAPEFEKRGVKMIGLSANTIDSHEGWIKDIDEVTGSTVAFPIIGDKQRQVALLYDM